MSSNYFSSKFIISVFKHDLFLPIILFLIYTGFFLFLRGHLPSGDQLIEIFGSLYSKYGYVILFASAFLESLFVINLFIPGQISMSLGVIFSRTGAMNFPLVVLTVVAGAFLAYLVDYVLGYYGLSRIFQKYGFIKQIEESTSVSENISNKKLALSFIHPNLGAFVSFGLGVVKHNLFKFFIFALIFTSIFTSLWSILIYIFSDVFLEIIRKYIYFVVVLVLAFTIFNNLRKKKG